MTVSMHPTQNSAETRERCVVEGCRHRSMHGGHCLPHYKEFCRRAGSIRVEGFDQGFADVLAAAGFAVVGRVPVVDFPEYQP